MEFEKFEDVGKSYAPNVAIRSAGQIGILVGAANRFGLNEDEHRYVEFYFSKEGNAIGIKPIKEPSDAAVKIRYNGDAADVSAKSFLDKYNINYEQTKRYGAEWDEERNMIVVFLDDEK